MTEPELVCQSTWSRNKACGGMVRELLMMGLGDWFRADTVFPPHQLSVSALAAVSDFDICYLISTLSTS